jgi:hypothetical protein
MSNLSVIRNDLDDHNPAYRPIDRADGQLVRYDAFGDSFRLCVSKSLLVTNEADRPNGDQRPCMHVYSYKDCIDQTARWHLQRFFLVAQILSSYNSRWELHSPAGRLPRTTRRSSSEPTRPARQCRPSGSPLRLIDHRCELQLESTER